MSYDVFISYRRKDGSDYARQIQLKLQNYGYNVFLDFDELKDSVFDKRIMNAISNSKVFIAILTPQYLSKASNPEDWVRKEIECAVEKGVHIVPINIDRQWQGFPSNCPEHIAKYIGQHQYSEIFTGSQFVTTMDDLNKHRLRPYIKVASMSQPAVGAVVRVRADMDCRIVKFGEDVGLVLAGKWATLRLKKGRHILDFVSTENPADHSEITYKVDDVDMDDFFEVVLKPIRQARIDKEAEERRKAEEEAEKQRKAEEAAERRRKAEEELKRRKAEEEAERKRKAAEEAERQRKAKEEAERKRKAEEEAERQRRAEEEAKRKRFLEELANKTYKIGDLYDDGTKKGIVFEVTADGKHGKIVSLEEAELPWSNTYKITSASNLTNGCENMRAMQIGIGWYPTNDTAFTWCASLGDDWYLPAITELESFTLNETILNKVNSKLMQLELTIINNYRNYWSSTEDDKYCAWMVYMTSRYTNRAYKSINYLVRAVAKF